MSAQNADTVAMRAFLYATDGQIVAVVKVADPPPDTLVHQRVRYVRAGSSNRLHEDGVEQLSWDYLPEQIDGRIGDGQS